MDDKKKQPYQITQDQKRNLHRTTMVPKPGFTWNPLRKIPRNMPCPCKSGQKFKSCHLEKLPLIVKNELAETFMKAMDSLETLEFVATDAKDVQ